MTTDLYRDQRRTIGHVVCSCVICVTGVSQALRKLFESHHVLAVHQCALLAGLQYCVICGQRRLLNFAKNAHTTACCAACTLRYPQHAGFCTKRPSTGGNKGVVCKRSLSLIMNSITKQLQVPACGTHLHQLRMQCTENLLHDLSNKAMHFLRYRLAHFPHSVANGDEAAVQEARYTE
jgi:hypothetical protein